MLRILVSLTALIAAVHQLIIVMEAHPFGTLALLLLAGMIVYAKT